MTPIPTSPTLADEFARHRRNFELWNFPYAETGNRLVQEFLFRRGDEILAALREASRLPEHKERDLILHIEALENDLALLRRSPDASGEYARGLRDAANVALAIELKTGDPKCVRGHDRCESGADEDCPYCERKTPVAAAILALPQSAAPAMQGRRWQHVKRGTTYVEIGRGQLQSGQPIEEDCEMVAYRSEHDGRVWFRPAAEFDDGRFIALPQLAAGETEDEQGERWLNNAGEDVHCIDLPSAIPEAARAETGDDIRPEKILDHKWLDPECIQNGCQSLIWKGRYESAVKGRADFRQAMKEARERIDAAVRAERDKRVIENNLAIALNRLIEAISSEEEHGDGADDDNCPVCLAIRCGNEAIRARATADEKERM